LYVVLIFLFDKILSLQKEQEYWNLLKPPFIRRFGTLQPVISAQKESILFL
jgi:hypothetical protein